jgi:hypothetical protein
LAGLLSKKVEPARYFFLVQRETERAADVLIGEAVESERQRLLESAFHLS